MKYGYDPGYASASALVIDTAFAGNCAPPAGAVYAAGTAVLTTHPGGGLDASGGGGDDGGRLGGLDGGRLGGLDGGLWISGHGQGAITPALAGKQSIT